MTTTDIGFLGLGLLVAMLAGVGRWVARLFHHDEIFVGVTPGLLPTDGAPAVRKRIRATPAYAGEVAVAFAPPRGLTPGLVGTVVDSTAHPRDVTATIVDLAVRGHLTIRPAPPNESESDGPSGSGEWLLHKVDPAPDDPLLLMESDLIQRLFVGGPLTSTARFAQHHGSMARRVQLDLYRQVIALGWYRRHPKQRGMGWPGWLSLLAGTALGALFALAQPTGPGIASGALVVAAAVWLALGLRGRTPRTAEGTAAYVQALGFKKYLATAEVDRFRHDEAASLFSRYLPYAIVFGVATHWAKVFGESLVGTHTSGLVAPDLHLGWFDTDLGDLLSLADLETDATGWDLDVDLADAGEGLIDGLRAFAVGVGEFVSSLDGLEVLGDGCIDF